MSKRFTKIICAVTSATFILGAVAVAGCSDYYKSEKLAGDYSGEVSSNGGFAVEKGNYVYYINGVEGGTALNDFGTPVKGAIYRISKDNLNKRNYSTVQKVVPSIAYTTDYNAGIFIYGDRIYYGTPSTAKNSEGVVQNSYLDMKSSKLDGTETMKNAYVSFPSASYEYRFVEDGADKTVYLLYVATSEKLYGESTGVTNLHSYNTKTGADTLLAYNVDKVVFDSVEKINPRVYYTMNVRNYVSSSDYGYNQLYTVTASAKEDKFADKLNSQTVKGWKDTDRYINCGELVLDGIGYTDYLGNELSLTPFNTGERNEDVTNKLSYTYNVRQYADGNVYYTRTTSLDSKAAYLFSLNDGDEIAPIATNAANPDGKAILYNGANAGDYKFVTVHEKPAVLYADGSNGITINYFTKDENNVDKLGSEASDIKGDDNTYYPVVKSNSATILHIEGDYLYYSVSGSDYSIYRVDYTGTPTDYRDAYLSVGANKDYEAVKILDLKAVSSWYKPEFIDSYIFFASSTTNMTAYNYIMVFDLSKGEGIMDNADIRDLNDKYEGVEKKIDEVYGDTDKYPEKTYANIKNALKYAFYNGDYDYLKKYAEELNAELEEGKDPVYSQETFAEYDKFLKAEGVWEEEYGGDNHKTVNGKEVYANNREYYYSLLGEMSGRDTKAYAANLQSTYLVAKKTPAVDTSWYDGLKTVEKVFFVIGMCLIGALVIGGGAWLAVYLVRRNKNKQPEERRRRIKVDTTDDKSVDVYGTEE